MWSRDSDSFIVSCQRQPETPASCHLASYTLYAIRPPSPAHVLAANVDGTVFTKEADVPLKWDGMFSSNVNWGIRNLGGRSWSSLVWATDSFFFLTSKLVPLLRLRLQFYSTRLPDETRLGLSDTDSFVVYGSSALKFVETLRDVPSGKTTLNATGCQVSEVRQHSMTSLISSSITLAVLLNIASSYLSCHAVDDVLGTRRLGEGEGVLVGLVRDSIINNLIQLVAAWSIKLLTINHR